MNSLIEQILNHPMVCLPYASARDFGPPADNEALQALCSLRRMKNEASRHLENYREDLRATGGMGHFHSLPRESPEREFLLVAYGLRTLCLPEDLALLVQTFVEGGDH